MSGNQAPSTGPVSVKDKVQIVMSHYDENNDGVLDENEIKRMKEEFHSDKSPAKHVLAHYAENGKLTEASIAKLKEDIHTTDMSLRYMAYAGFAARAVRYLAYTSDFGEAFRPVVHPMVVRGAYGVSWAYVLGDVGFESYQLSNHHGVGGADLYAMTAKRMVFQSIASMALPAFTIHTVVHEMKKVCKKAGKYQKWGPSACGLAIVPFLPLYDHPVEHVIDTCFNWMYKPSHPYLVKLLKEDSSGGHH
jgi:fission process protein 1